MEAVDCPIADCTYSGAPESVEAHISRLQRDGHQGEVGRAHRDDLLARTEGREQEEESTENLDEQGETTSGPLEVDGESVPSSTALVVLTVLFLLVVLAHSFGSSESSEEPIEESGDQDSEEEIPLVEG